MTGPQVQAHFQVEQWAQNLDERRERREWENRVPKSLPQEETPAMGSAAPEVQAVPARSGVVAGEESNTGTMNLLEEKMMTQVE